MKKNILMIIIPSCKENSLLMARREAGNLGLRGRFRIFLHLALCKWCRWYEKQMRLMKAACQRPTEPAPMPADAKERIAARLSDELGS
jgi:hypothetical protein